MTWGYAMPCNLVGMELHLRQLPSIWRQNVSVPLGPCKAYPAIKLHVVTSQNDVTWKSTFLNACCTPSAGRLGQWPEIGHRQYLYLRSMT